LIPVWKLELENETEIPEMPKEILAKPDDKIYDKLVLEQDEKIDHHWKSIVINNH
jgi:hypothetical protein